MPPISHLPGIPLRPTAHGTGWSGSSGEARGAPSGLPAWHGDTPAGEGEWIVFARSRLARSAAGSSSMATVPPSGQGRGEFRASTQRKKNGPGGTKPPNPIRSGEKGRLGHGSVIPRSTDAPLAERDPCHGRNRGKRLVQYVATERDLTEAQEELRRLTFDWVEALAHKDVDRLMALSSPDVQLFHLEPRPSARGVGGHASTFPR